MQKISLHRFNCAAKMIGSVPSYWTQISLGNDRTVEPSKGSLREGWDD